VAGEESRRDAEREADADLDGGSAEDEADDAGAVV
jgi:hypothetical protein